VTLWEDCGQRETILKTNRTLLARDHASDVITGQNCVIIPPVYVSPSAVIENAVIGPYVSIDDRARIVSSIVRDSIIESGAVITDSTLQASLIGRNATITGRVDELNVGDNAVVA
jgi:glucose-1-phosphate thymidylyltransferase